MVNKIECGPYTLDYEQKTIVMGILNVNPDSFSDGGKYNEVDKAVERAIQMVEDGADIIDIGGESTRPGYTEISVEEELERVIPIIERLKMEVEVPLSIDTYKGEVARQSLRAGAHVINDIWGAKRDSNMAAIAAEYQAPLILMHNRDNLNYTSFLEDVVSDLQESIDIAIGAGVSNEKIILDPGIGFAKDLNGNLEMMRGLDRLVAMGYPVLLATSRKSLIGNVLNLPVEERIEGTGATICYGIQKGCQLIRVHDVKEMTRMARMMDALMGKGEYSG
ncbi:dihydropteroate synthase [Cytobacillus oceanisediminis]|uniref:Dihydropteroate synthase n=1 Tax=Niallia alba TaxID=2729105 RepID=A0A7Y0K511_9BACI|nr:MULTISPECIES: dihydropteroate synthase [Bacillaceae]EOR21809.1 dihydropteroate synthase [Niallia nealsonii AAU1]MDU1847485.1 dihydropteroate synthase [Niallia nealsonii]MBZ9535196.1 dihydropteroate synthase [Cytobacillus oceanisediminis]NMO75540.1 dihydropteroate synthase [Niallia alba]UTI43405.1 dihydropteroate synthase [Niallia sp. RD1]